MLPRAAWVRTALLALLFPAAVFGLVEAGTRLLVNVPRPLLLGPGACTRRDALLGYSFVPRCVGTMADAPVRTNSLGQRGDEIADDGSRRILTIGDSCTWGYRVKEEESYPAVLQRLLDEGAGKSRYRVINAGVPGFTSHHGLLYLRERGLLLHPALVVIGYEWNDGMPMGDVESRLERVLRFHRLLVIDDWLRGRSAFYRLAAYRVGRRALSLTAEPQVPTSRYRDNIATMVRLARDHGAEAVLIDWMPARADYPPVLDELSAELAVPVVRFYGPRLPGDNVHPSPDGYRRFATVLYGRLREAGYVDEG